jgi:hypothetical protein
MDSFSHESELQLDVGILQCIDAGLGDIALRANHQWTVETYWALVLEVLERAQEELEQEYATNLAAQDKNRMRDRERLFKSFEQSCIFDVHFSYYISEGESVLLDNSEYQPLIDWLRRMLRADGVMSTDEIRWEAIREWTEFTGGKGIPKLYALSLQPKAPTSPVDYTPLPSDTAINPVNQDIIAGQVGDTEPAPSKQQDDDDYRPVPSEQHEDGVSAPKPRERNYSEAMTNEDLYQFAKKAECKFTKADLARAIREDPECRTTKSRKRHQFDMNTFTFLQNRGNQKL